MGGLDNPARCIANTLTIERNTMIEYQRFTNGDHYRVGLGNQVFHP